MHAALQLAFPIRYGHWAVCGGMGLVIQGLVAVLPIPAIFMPPFGLAALNGTGGLTVSSPLRPARGQARSAGCGRRSGDHPLTDARPGAQFRR